LIELTGFFAAHRLARANTTLGSDTRISLIRDVSLTEPPGATPLLARLLATDPDPWVRAQAVAALARIGSPRALVAIRSAIELPEPVSAWWQPPRPDAEVVTALTQATDPLVPLAEETRTLGFSEDWKVLEYMESCRFEDSEGAEWVVFPRATLGSSGDLWLSRRKDGGEWEPGKFIGQIAPPPRPCNTPELSRQCAIRNGQLFIGDAAGWSYSVFLTSIGLDRDGDGLSDLVEERVHTDPERADTDGDGLTDPLDPAPNARSQRPLTENDAVTLAVLRQIWMTTDVPPFRSPLMFIESRTAPEWRRKGGVTISVTTDKATPPLPPGVERILLYWLPEVDPGYWLSQLDERLPRSLLGDPERTYVSMVSDSTMYATVRKMAGDWYVVDFGD
jgi:HEAT repeats